MAVPSVDEVASADELLPTYNRAPHESPPVVPPAYLAASRNRSRCADAPCCKLDRLERVESDMAFLEQRLQEKLKPYADQLARLDEIPGVDWTLAAVIIAELGVDTSVFPSVSQLTSWAGDCPGNNVSTGKRKSSRVPKGNVYLKTALVEAANAAAQT